MKSNFVLANTEISTFAERVRHGTAPTCYKLPRLGNLEIWPGQVTLLGGAPCAGKTAFAMQLVVDILRLNKDCRAMICSVEMPRHELFERQVSRISGVDLTTIRHRELKPEHTDSIESAISALKPVYENLGFILPPYSLENISKALKEFKPNALLIDYIQRISVSGEYSDKRNSMNAVMGGVRSIADDGVAVIAISAMGRGKAKSGKNAYDKSTLGLGSFRESSELEYGCDDAYILLPDDDGGSVLLSHVKSRYGARNDRDLEFDGSLQRFMAGAAEEPEVVAAAVDAAMPIQQTVAA
jgi:replicative DNA helicase